MVKQQQNENIKSMEVVDCNVNNLDNFIKEKKENTKLVMAQITSENNLKIQILFYEFPLIYY